MNTTELLNDTNKTALILHAYFEPIDGGNRFQPTGFPELGAVIYEAPGKGNKAERVCIIDSAASMANHLESVCIDATDGALHPELAGLPHVVCVTDRNGHAPAVGLAENVVCTTFTEGHRLASDYFLDALIADDGSWGKQSFRERLRQEFGIEEVVKDKTYYIYPSGWWSIFKTIFKYDPNSLVHGILFAKEQIKISRILTANFEAFGAKTVARSGVKFDRLGKTLSGQPIFSIEDVVADKLVATFVIDLGLLRSYGREGKGLTDAEKELLLKLALWKIKQMTSSPFRFRSGCFLRCNRIEIDGREAALPDLHIGCAIAACALPSNPTTVYYPAKELFKAAKEEKKSTAPIASADHGDSGEE